MAIESVVADAGPLIALARVDALRLLPVVFRVVSVTPEVIAECLAKPERSDAVAIQAALDVGLLRLVLAPSALQPAQGLGPGESSAIALALQEHAAVLVDDRFARRVAVEHGLQTVGSLSVLIACKRRGHLASIRPALSTLLESRYFLSGSVVDDALRLAGEEPEP